jgi:hypothetical protein
MCFSRPVSPPYFTSQNRGALCSSRFQLRDGGLIKTENDSRFAYQNRPFDQVRTFRHQSQSLGARRRVFFHAALAKQLIARVEKLCVIAITDQFVELRDRELSIEIGLFKRDPLFAKQTLRFAAARSSGLEIEVEHSTIIGQRPHNGARRVERRNSRPLALLYECRCFATW